MIQLDQSKASDHVNHDFLWSVLETTGIPDNPKSLYSQSEVIPYWEGFFGPPIPIGRGVRQGCPLSPLLYVITLEALLSAIRTDTSIKGFIPHLDMRYGLTAVAHADDVYVWVEDDDDITTVKKHLETHGIYSGAQINQEKSKLYSLDGARGNIKLGCLESKENHHIPEGPEDIARTGFVEGIKILGVVFFLNPQGWWKNWSEWEKRVLTSLGKWKSWRLSTAKKVTFL